MSLDPVLSSEDPIIDAKGFEPYVPLAHILAQSSWHQPAFLIGNRRGLLAIREAITAALTMNAPPIGVELVPADGEGFQLIVKLASEAEIDEAPLGYTDEMAKGETPYPDWMGKQTGLRRQPAWWTAEKLARELHGDQFDKIGVPYVEHLEQVVLNLIEADPNASQDEIDAAWLHDAIEDRGATEESLLAAGISQRTIQIVKLLSIPPAKVDYLDYIREIAASGDVGAIRVKLADNKHNQDPDRVRKWKGGARQVHTRYEPARKILQAALDALVQPGAGLSPR